MDDSFLYDLRRSPRPAFERLLRSRLQERATARPVLAPRFTRWAAAAAAIVLVGGAFTVPAVRAGAQAFLDLFRIQRFAAVAFDAGNLRDVLRDVNWESLDFPQMLGENVDVLAEPTPPTSYATLEEAEAAAGIPLLTPAWTPVDMQIAAIGVVGERAARFTAHTALLDAVLAELGIDDVAVPAGLDGAEITVRVPPIAQITYHGDRSDVHLVQAQSPDVTFPAGVDLASLAEVGLRILGLDRDAAYRVAQSVDWRSTLIVPVPTQQARFTEIDVAGEPGLLIEQRLVVSTGGSASVKLTNVVLWTSAGRVFALEGKLASTELLEMAQTLQ